MIRITNKKIAGFSSQWAPYRGFSLLFDNPGKSLSPMDVRAEATWLKINCSVDTDDHLKLYRGLARSLEVIGEQWLIDAYLFCPLPSYSYHVTVWNGLTDGNIQSVLADRRQDLEGFLKNLPGSLLIDDKVIGEIRSSSLVNDTGWATRFKFSGLSKWGNQVLVARLMPADQNSEKVLDHIIEGRRVLCAVYGEQLGIQRPGNYTPHVTLGYFANEGCADLSTSQVDRWTKIVENEAGDETITFSSISLYGFTDMVTFFKMAQGVSSPTY